jgi:ferredoxin
MEYFILPKSNIKKLLAKAAEAAQVYAPVKDIGGDVNFRLVNDDDEVSLDSGKTVIGPKKVFFPQSEILLKFNNNELSSCEQYAHKILFGVSSCDLAAILFTDVFWRRHYEDAYYLSRIKDRLIIVNGCREVKDECFCKEAGTGPFAKEGFDLQLIDSDVDFFVEAATRAGMEFAAKYNDCFFEATDFQVKELSAIKKEAENKALPEIGFKTAIDKLKTNNILHEQIDRIAAKCICCGGCLYVCPTCTCFNVYDKGTEKEGTRSRNWDTCVFEGYTREASGHNPRKDIRTRTIRRFEHKLKYDMMTTGRSGCVGCGRCRNTCPVDISIEKLIRKLAGQSIN